MYLVIKHVYTIYIHIIIILFVYIQEILMQFLICLICYRYIIYTVNNKSSAVQNFRGSLDFIKNFCVFTSILIPVYQRAACSYG